MSKSIAGAQCVYVIKITVRSIALLRIKSGRITGLAVFIMMSAADALGESKEA